MLRVDKQSNSQIISKIPTLLKKPAFIQSQPLWIKQSQHPTIQTNNLNGRRYQYSKIGKTFGFQANRYLQLYQDSLFYYDDQHHHQYKGYCLLENVYVQWFTLQSNRYLLYMTNGADHSYFYFTTPTFWRECQNSIAKFAIQLDCRERYEFIEQIGKGSFSKVFHVRNKQTNKEYAAKVMDKLDKHKTCTKKIVVQQRKILRMINSQYVYQFEELYEENQCFIVMVEYLQGKDLMSLYKDKKVKDPEILKEILRQILKGINDIHKANIIHRDLKPQNILINPTTLKPCIIDFGLSLHLQESTHPRSFKRCGTMGYMAPQVIENSSGDYKKGYGVKCDLFSFGIIAHMLLLGYNPLKGDDYDSTYINNRDCSFSLNKSLINSLYGEYCFIFLTKALSKQPHFRYSSEQALNSLFLKQTIDKEQSSSTVQQKTKIPPTPNNTIHQ